MKLYKQFKGQIQKKINSLIFKKSLMLYRDHLLMSEIIVITMIKRDKPFYKHQKSIKKRYLRHWKQKILKI
jgi:hypothetical protein